MKEEMIRDLLFGKGSDVSLKTIHSLRETGLLPHVLTDGNVKKWKKTFVGNFVCSYPNRYGIVEKMRKLFGKLPELNDFSEDNLELLVNSLKETESPGTARQYASLIKSTITRLLESNDCRESIPCRRYMKVLSLKGCPTTKTYMSLDDLKKFMSYEPKNTRERNCKAVFTVMLMTGARYSDAVSLKSTYIQGDVLTFVPKKTKFHGTVVSIRVGDEVSKCIEHIEKNKCDYHVGYFNETIKQICKNCGMTEEVTYFHAGKVVTKPKCDAMRSHLGRASFVTNMLKLGQPIHEVSKMAGHTDIAMTSRYNASTDVKLTKEANDFINMKF